MAGDSVIGVGNGDDGGAASRLPMFRGVTHLSLDAKGRLAVPARHRDTLLAAGGGRLVLTADPNRCLLVYPLAAWEPIEARLINRSIEGAQRSTMPSNAPFR